ncbi:MAG: hypothetical protein JXC32_16300 [Anaerolineae bacterium]|nr:hypothetical protein [Anaerolineae bacterium]
MRSLHSDLVDHPSTWRFSLQDSQTQKKQAFPDLTVLVSFLQTELGMGILDHDQAQTLEEEKR